LLTRQPQLRMLLLQTMIKLRETTIARRQIIIHRHFQPLLADLQLAQQFLLITADHFRRGGRRGGAQIGNEIGDSHIRFMPHGADHRNGAGEDRPRDPLVVKTPQIFQRSAAATDD